MDREEALDHVDEITVRASEKKILSEFEPAESAVTLTASIPQGADVTEIRDELAEAAQEQAKRDVLRRWESYIRKQDD